MEQLTELGIKSREMLLRGEAIPENMVVEMLEIKINSPEVAHHGYVVDGFPAQSESNSLDIHKQMDMLKNWKMQPDFIINLRVNKKLDNFYFKKRKIQ